MNCQSCGGLILAPNQVYGYAGPICYCGYRTVQLPYIPNQIIPDQLLPSDRELLKQILEKLDLLLSKV